MISADYHCKFTKYYSEIFGKNWKWGIIPLDLYHQELTYI